MTQPFSGALERQELQNKQRGASSNPLLLAVALFLSVIGLGSCSREPETYADCVLKAMEGTGKSDLAVSTIKEACRQKFPGALVDSPHDDFMEWRWFDHPCGRYGIKMLAVRRDSSVEWGWRIEIAEEEAEHFRDPERGELNLFLVASDESGFEVCTEMGRSVPERGSSGITFQEVASERLTVGDARRIATWELRGMRLEQGIVRQFENIGFGGADFEAIPVKCGGDQADHLTDSTG